MEDLWKAVVYMQLPALWVHREMSHGGPGVAIGWQGQQCDR